MRLLCSMGQHDSTVSYKIVSNKNYTYWSRIILYSCMTCGFDDHPHTIKRDVPGEPGGNEANEILP